MIDFIIEVVVTDRFHCIKHYRLHLFWDAWKYIRTFYNVPSRGWHMHMNLSPSNTRAHVSYEVNAMASDGQATQGARPSQAMFLIELSLNVSVPHRCDEMNRRNILKIDRNVLGNQIKVTKFETLLLRIVSLIMVMIPIREAKQSYDVTMNPFCGFIFESEMTLYMPQLYIWLH